MGHPADQVSRRSEGALQGLARQEIAVCAPGGPAVGAFPPFHPFRGAEGHARGDPTFFRDLAETYPKLELHLLLRPDASGTGWSTGLWMTIQLSVVCVILSVDHRRRRRLAAGFIELADPGAPDRAGLHPVLPQHAAAGAAPVLLFRARPVHADLFAPTAGSRCRSFPMSAGRSFRCPSSPAPSTWRSSAPASRRCRNRPRKPLKRSAFSRLQILHLRRAAAGLPRVSLPALNNNLVNLVKTTTQAYGIAVPELLYEMVSIWNDYVDGAERRRCWCCSWSTSCWSASWSMGMHRWEAQMRIPGYGA